MQPIREQRHRVLKADTHTGTSTVLAQVDDFLSAELIRRQHLADLTLQEIEDGMVIQIESLANSPSSKSEPEP